MGLNINATKKNTTVNIALTGLMGALVIVGTFLNIPVPVLGDRTMIGLGNVFCILSGLLLGPIYGGAAAGIGSGVFDRVGGWATSAPTTLINKFMMAFVCGAIAWSGKSEGRKAGRIILGAVSGSLTYCVLYMTKSLIEASLLGNAQEAIAVLLTTKLLATLVNAVIADVVAVPLSIAVRKSLERNKMYLGVVSQAQGRLSRVELHRLLTAVLLVIQAVLQIVCIAVLLPGIQTAAAELAPTPTVTAPLYWAAAVLSAVQIICALLYSWKKGPYAYAAGACNLLSLVLAALFLFSSLASPVLVKYLPIGVIFTVLLAAALFFFFSGQRRAQKKPSAK